MVSLFYILVDELDTTLFPILKIKQERLLYIIVGVSLYRLLNSIIFVNNAVKTVFFLCISYVQ